MFPIYASKPIKTTKNCHSVSLLTSKKLTSKSRAIKMLFQFFLCFWFLTCTQSWSPSQVLFLQKFDHCILRLVFLEKSIPAVQDVTKFLDHYALENNTFILESRPADESKIQPYTKFQTTRQTQMKFTQCYSIFYFQDHVLEAVQNGNFTDVTNSQSDFFRVSPVTRRNENPTSIVYITLNNSQPDSNLYKYAAYIDVTSTFHVFSSQKVFLICITCVAANFLFEIQNSSNLSDLAWRTMHLSHGTWIYTYNLVSKPWDVENGRKPYACEIFPTPLTFIIHPKAEYCFLRSIKSRLNLTSDRDKGIPVGLATFLLMAKSNLNLLFSAAESEQI